jgi:hypothetical protein
MTGNGWLQIALFGVIVIVITKPFGGYMTRVFAGERTFLSPVLRPLERFIYWCSGVDETEEQSWRIYTVSMLFLVSPASSRSTRCSACNGICRLTRRRRPGWSRCPRSTPR